MSSKKSNVLVIDDDIRMLRMMKRMLELEGFQVVIANSGEMALKSFERESPDLILLDIMMPDMDGYTVCHRIREFSQVPIIMVTAKGDDKEKVQGLNMGADDYVTKFQPQEAVFHNKDLVIDFASRRVMVNDAELKLTSTEYKLLSYISLNAGRVITPDQLLDKVWGEEYMGAPHLLQVNIARLRKKLGDDAKQPTYIITRPGIGYFMSKPS